MNAVNNKFPGIAFASSEHKSLSRNTEFCTEWFEHVSESNFVSFIGILCYNLNVYTNMVKMLNEIIKLNLVAELFKANRSFDIFIVSFKMY